MPTQSVSPSQALLLQEAKQATISGAPFVSSDTSSWLLRKYPSGAPQELQDWFDNAAKGDRAEQAKLKQCFIRLANAVWKNEEKVNLDHAQWAIDLKFFDMAWTQNTALLDDWLSAVDMFIKFNPSLGLMKEIHEPQLRHYFESIVVDSTLHHLRHPTIQSLLKKEWGWKSKDFIDLEGEVQNNPKLYVELAAHFITQTRSNHSFHSEFGSYDKNKHETYWTITAEKMDRSIFTGSIKAQHIYLSNIQQKWIQLVLWDDALHHVDLTKIIALAGSQKKTPGPENWTVFAQAKQPSKNPKYPNVHPGMVLQNIYNVDLEQPITLKEKLASPRKYGSAISPLDWDIETGGAISIYNTLKDHPSLEEYLNIKYKKSPKATKKETLYHLVSTVTNEFDLEERMAKHRETLLNKRLKNPLNEPTQPHRARL